MRVYECINCEATVITDAYKMEPQFNGILFKVQSRMVEKKEDDGGVARNVDEDAEEGATAEAGDNAVAKVIDIVDANQYQKLEGWDVKAWMGDLKSYIKTVTEAAKAQGVDEKEFQAQTKAFAAFVKENKDSCDFYRVGHKDDYDSPELAMTVIAHWEDGADAPALYYWTHGLKSYKV